MIPLGAEIRFSRMTCPRFSLPDLPLPSRQPLFQLLSTRSNGPATTTESDGDDGVVRRRAGGSRERKGCKNTSRLESIPWLVPRISLREASIALLYSLAKE